ncbi:hypothetical protein C1280_01660 [Gemmata obscuriglobus]|uniref:DNA-binding protein n=1 Tax=Gemmata obscuriglobus TaxID=114 RepID=A0A2Z3GTJ5_9BACT|nr:hypothetical protein C1280_01660 [Gemmata obscuriglobus]
MASWLPAPEAARLFDINYKQLCALVHEGVFTRGKFGAAKKRPPIYLRVAELEAWKRGGVPAVAPIKAAYEAEQIAHSGGGA